jgi:hypothetical protein
MWKRQGGIKFAYGNTNRLSNFQSEKVFDKLHNDLKSPNIETCKANRTLKTMVKKL